MTAGEGNSTEQERKPRRREAPPTAEQKQAAEEQSGQREPRFSMDRLRGTDGPAIVEQAFAAEDEQAPMGAGGAAVLAGALHGLDEDEELTRAELRERVRRYLEHEDTTTQEG